VAALWVIATAIAIPRLVRLRRQGQLSQRLLMPQIVLWLACGLIISNGFLGNHVIASIAVSVLSSACLIVGIWLTFKKPVT